LAILDETPSSQKALLPVLVNRNWALLALGDTEEAGKGIDQGLKQGRVPDLLLQDALRKYKRQDFNGARQCLEEILKANPEDMRALSVLTAMLYQRRQVPELLQRVRASVAARPKSAPLNYLLATWLERTGDRKGARAALASAKVADPSYRLAPVALSRLDIMDGKADSAHQVLTALIGSDPGDVQARLTLGMLEDKLENVPGAIEHYRKVLEREPNNIIALNNLAYRLADRDTDEALRLAQRAKELAPEDPYVATTIGWIFYRRGIYQTALQHLEMAVAKAPTPLRQYYLSMAYFKLGRVKQGEQVLQAALKVDPKLPQAKTALEVAKSAQPPKNP
jgi:tetratricopeptide (TPR) repeat protein